MEGNTLDYNDDRANRYFHSPEDEGEIKRSRKTIPEKKPASPHIQKKLKKREKRRKRKSIFRSLFTACLVMVIIFTIIGTGVCIGMYTAVSTEIADMNLTALTFNNESFLMYYDEDGNEQELQKISSAGNEKSKWISSEEISPYLKMAAIAIEDERFEKHHGVDIKRTLGATVGFVSSKLGFGSSNYGGSTITQQVIKNITKENDRSATRKLKEIMRAIALEQNLSKDEILTVYLNIIALANNIKGVEKAANIYFGKPASEVTIAEAASIVGITQRPEAFNPYKNPKDHITKRDKVLTKMYELGYITKSEYKTAKNTELELVDTESTDKKEISSYFADQVIRDVVSDLQTKKGYSEDLANQQVVNGGYKIYTTIDLEIQDSIEEVFEDTSNFPDKKAQAAMVIIDPHTGEVKGMVGQIGKKTDVMGLNRATQSYRQPGSSIKPLSAYAPAIEQNKIEENTIITDEKIKIDNWSPNNSNGKFLGDMTVKEAVARSTNTVAAKVVEMIGVNKSYAYLEKNFGITSLAGDSDKNCAALALGGLTKGVNTEQMAAAYATFANGGKYYKPITYTKVIDGAGNVVLENKQEPVQALKPTTSYIMANLLRAPIELSMGTAKSAKLSGMTTYGKTGTTNDNKDKWFVGFTPYYVGAVWYGYDQPKSISGSNPATGPWKKVMTKIHEGLDNARVKQPDGLEEVDICLDSGKIARRGCSSETAYFEEGEGPNKKCNGHSSDKEYSSPKPSPSESPSASPTGYNMEAEDEDDTLSPTKPSSSPPNITPKPTPDSEPAETKPPEPTPKAPSGDSEQTQTNSTMGQEIAPKVPQKPEE